MNNFSRRDFLKLTVAALAVSSVSSMLTGCAAVSDVQNFSRATFSHGVASGDATQNSVILWTRALPLQAGVSAVNLGWQLALDAQFNQVVRSGQVSTSAERDFTVKVDVQELPAGSNYFYRFIGADANPMMHTVNGLRNKTWLSGINTHSVGGFYEFDSIENARAYAEGMLSQFAKAANASLTVKLFDGEVVATASQGMHSPYYVSETH
jgi:phosphodiesterase/alkaline phosphatase D-like protein